jgi:hypothetical protein
MKLADRIENYDEDEEIDDVMNQSFHERRYGRYVDDKTKTKTTIDLRQDANDTDYDDDDDDDYSQESEEYERTTMMMIRD